METPHHRRHRKLDTTDRRKTNYEKSAKRRMNNTVPKQAPLTSPDSPVVLLSVVKQIRGGRSQKPQWWYFPLYEPLCVGASDHPDTGLYVQARRLTGSDRRPAKSGTCPCGLAAGNAMAGALI